MSRTVRAGAPASPLDEYDFELPESHIAQSPAPRREDARMLVLARGSGEILAAAPELRVRHLPEWLRPGDLLVVNATRVLPARLLGRKRSGGAAEVLLLGPAPEDERPGASRDRAFRALLRCTGRIRVGLELELGTNANADTGSRVEARIADVHERGEVTLHFATDVDPYALGHAPLPPYIRRDAPDETLRREDLERYQTVYAREPGAVAAPTAGLHLTREILDALSRAGVELAEVVLHVGWGTFRPLDEAALASGRLHAERFVLPEATAEAIARTRARGGRVFAVGTTTTRVLESRARDDGRVRPGRGETDLFLRPGGAPIRVVDGLLTNFHLPRSSLLMLVATLVGRDSLLAAYRHAIAEGFRFYSYGDAMLIVPDGAPHSAPHEGGRGAVDG